MRAVALVCMAWLAAGVAPAEELDDCLNRQDLVRVARVLDPDGRVVYARVTDQRDGHVTRAAWLAPGGTSLSEVFERAEREAAGESADGSSEFDVSDDRVCAVVDLPESLIDGETRVIVSTGLNYAAHAEEAGGGDVFLFPKPAAPTRPYAPVYAPAGVSLLDYEVELALILLEDVDLTEPPSREELWAKSAFFLSNDVSDREAIVRNAAFGGPGTGFVEGKGQPGFMPAGPWMVRGNQLFAALHACGEEGLGLRLWIDDELAPRQDAHTGQMILQPDELIARIGSWVREFGRRTPMPFVRNSQERFYPLSVGEGAPMLTRGSIVQTGTPEGVALKAPSPLGVTLRGALRLRSPFEQFLLEEKARFEAGGTGYLVPGSVVRARIDGLGTQLFEIGEAGGRAKPHACDQGERG